MSSSFNESNLIKKLEHVSNTQDSIQTLSLWVLHHKTHYKQIVEQWLRCFLKAKSSHQLALFYLANDIVQHAKRKSLTPYLSEFMNALRYAVKAASDQKIIPNINRVFNIWLDRSIYSKEFIEELRTSLGSENEKLQELTKFVSDYSLDDLIQQITTTTKVEQFTKTKLQSLVNCKVDFANTELLNKLKDKSYGEQFSKEFDEATKCLDSVIGALEKELLVRKELLLKLEKAKIFYDIQLNETKKCIDSYGISENKISEAKAKLSNSSSPQKTGSVSNDNISTSQLSSVMNMIHQAQNKNSVKSSLDQRLTSLMSNSSGQFGLALGSQADNQLFGKSYDPGFQPASYNPSSFDSNYVDHFYLPQEELGISGSQIDSMVNARGLSGLEPTENMEPADMDLGDSDDEDTLKVNKLGEDKMKRRPIEAMPFMTAQDISGLFPMIPPPPPPPIPPPVLKDLFGPPVIDDEFDPYRALHHNPLEVNLQHGNSIRNLADRPNRHLAGFHQPNHNNNNNSNHWRNAPDNRQGHRNSNFNSPHSNQANRWKNNNRGSWKRNNFGNHH